MNSDQLATIAPYPLTANSALCDPSQTEAFLEMLFGDVDFGPGQVISLLGIGEAGTGREGVFQDRQIVTPGFIGGAHAHIKRWSEWHAASFVVPAVLHAAAAEKGNVTEDKIAAFTALVLDLDTGDVTAKAAWVTERLGKPTMVVLSGGKTADGQAKRHLWWCLSEPTEEVARVGVLRKLLAAKAGGDQSFGRVTQVVRIAGSVHCKNGVPSPVVLAERNDRRYSLEDLAEIIENMLPMPGVEVATAAAPVLTLAGGMDFTPRQDTAIAALHRDVSEGGEDLTRWSEFSKVAGFSISEARAGRLTPLEAAEHAHGWMLLHMTPAWPRDRFEQEFRGLWNKDLANHGPMPAAPVPWSNVAPGEALPLEYFGDIQASLTNSWLVRGWLPRPGLGAIYGYPGSGKSFLAIDLALRVASGWPVDGRAVQTAPVICIAAEGQNGVRNRVAAFRRRHSVEAELPFAMIPCAVNLLDPHADISRLIEKISEAAERFGAPPGLIVVDTLAATFGGGDENTSAMVGYINNLSRMRDHFSATVAIVHHRPKDATNNTPRGHSSLMGAMDTIILVEDGRARTASITKQKDAEAGPAIAFGLESVTLGKDEEGEAVTAAVVKYLKLSAEKLTGAAQAVLNALAEAIEDAGGDPVTEAAWRTQWIGTLPEGTSDEAQRKAWQRARVRLLQLGRVRTQAGQWSIEAALSDTATMDFSIAAGAQP